MQTLSFDHPQYWLLLLPVGLLMWWISSRSQAPLAPDQLWQSLALRILASLFVVAAIAGPVVSRDSRDQSVIFLVDVSRSISPAARSQEFSLVRSAIAGKPRGDSAGVVEFASNPSLIVSPSTSPQPPQNHVGVEDSTTDIGEAIRSASAALPATGGRQIVLISDGNETNGSALQEASAAGIPVSSVDPAEFLGSNPDEASLARADLPPLVHDGEPIELRVVAASSVAQTAKLTVTCAGKKLAEQPITLGVGKNLARIPIRLTGAGIQEVSVHIDAPSDTILDNNSVVAVTRVVGQPHVLYLTDNPQGISKTVLRAMQAQSIVLDLKSANQAPRDVAGFAAYDGVVISNTPAGELAPDQQTALQSAVRDFGIGLGMVGGTNSYIGGGWADTPVEQALPVLMKPRAGEKLPNADIVVILDASGSMSVEEGGTEKVQLAARAAVSMLGALQPSDRVAVIAVTTEAKLVLPFSKPKDALAAQKDIEGVEAGGGGIYCLTGLQAAYELLDSSTAPIRHVVICPDTNDSEEQQHCVELARTMRDSEHVTTSVCGIGDWGDRDVTFQQELADAGGGQMYVVNQATDLPRFFQRDAGHFQAPPYVEGSFSPRVDAADKLLSGINLASEPPLLGYNIVTAKPDATVPMRAPSKPDPILAYRTYGLGHTFAFTSDETDHWAAKWLPWSGYQQFWAQVLRWSLRSERPADFQAFADLQSGSGQGHVVVDAFSPDGSYLNGATFAAVVAGPLGAPSRIPLAQSAPGRYEAVFPASHVGAYLITVARPGSPDSGTAELGLAQSYPAEFAQTGANMPLLRQLADATGGRILSAANSVWQFRPSAVPIRSPLAPVCLLLAVLLFIADIAWRRLGLRLKASQVVEPALTLVGGVAGAGAGLARSAAESRDRAAKERQTRSHIQTEADQAALLSRPVGSRMALDEPLDRDSFPLVASLDDLRRRERARESSDSHDRRSS